MASEHELRLVEYERQVDELQSQLKGLEEEVVVLRRRLQDAPKRVRTLEERLLETKGQLAQAVSQNEKLSATLREAREHIAALREEVEKLTPADLLDLIGVEISPARLKCALLSLDTVAHALAEEAVASQDATSST